MTSVECAKMNYLITVDGEWKRVDDEGFLEEAAKASFYNREIKVVASWEAWK